MNAKCMYSDFEHIVSMHLKIRIYRWYIITAEVCVHVWILCSEKENLDEADGNHELSPAGDEYAIVDKSSKRKPVAAAENQALYQVHVQ